MSWSVLNNTIKMTESDFGVALPIELTGMEIAASDTVKLTVKNEVNGEPLLEYSYTNITDGKVNLVISESDSAKLPSGTYFYVLDWCKDGSFMYNIIECGLFKVVDKA